MPLLRAPARVSLIATLIALAAGCSSSVQPSDAADGSADAADTSRVDAQPDAAPDVQPDAPPDAAPDVVDADVPPTPSGIGNPCTGSGGFPPDMGDCAQGQECLPEQYGFPGGYCSQDCSGGRACPGDAVCVNVMDRFPICLVPCTLTSDCRADEGYTCQATETGVKVCLPTDGPVGTRNGEACYTTTAGPNQLPELPRIVFSGANIAATAGRTDLTDAAEGNIAISPVNGAAVVAYIAEDRGQVFMGTTVTPDGTSLIQTGAATDPNNPLTSDPVLAYTADGKVHMVYLGYNSDFQGNPTMMRVRIADSMDDGANWSIARAIEPLGTCRTFCDKPWITVGPGPGGTGESIYVVYLSEDSTGMMAGLLVQRSDDGGMTWTAPATMGRQETLSGITVVPNLTTLAVGADGTVYAAYVGLYAFGDQTAMYGSRGSKVIWHSSTDGGQTWSVSHVVSRSTDSPVYTQPWIGVDGDAIYIAYVSGMTTGAWDLFLATSVDRGATFVHRKVNDEPDTCATHAFPAMAVDAVRHQAHLTWLENRFGEGDVAYAVCPQDATMPCSPNQAVSDAPFEFTTSRDPSRWHGDYEGLAVNANGDLWAGWSDTRTLRPAVYMAHGRLQ